jgi:uncharacterized phage protein (TIGR01671 family)
VREIKFRGKRIDNGAFVVGDLTRYSEEMSYITVDLIEGEVYQVTSKTVGQYTGLKDKNGREIYEGDIVEFEDIGEDGYEYKEAYDFINRAVVVWGKGRFVLDCFGNDNSGVIDDMNNRPEDFYNMFEHYAEVIGNIHDNPELLGVKE